MLLQGYRSLGISRSGINIRDDQSIRLTSTDYALPSRFISSSGLIRNLTTRQDLVHTQSPQRQRNNILSTTSSNPQKPRKSPRTFTTDSPSPLISLPRLGLFSSESHLRPNPERLVRHRHHASPFLSGAAERAPGHLAWGLRGHSRTQIQVGVWALMEEAERSSPLQGRAGCAARLRVATRSTKIEDQSCDGADGVCDSVFRRGQLHPISTFILHTKWIG